LLHQPARWATAARLLKGDTRIHGLADGFACPWLTATITAAQLSRNPDRRLRLTRDNCRHHTRTERADELGQVAVGSALLTGAGGAEHVVEPGPDDSGAAIRADILAPARDEHPRVNRGIPASIGHC